MSPAQPLIQPTTLIEEMLADDAFDRAKRLPVLELTHLEPAELARYIDETCGGDPRYDFAGHLTDGIDDMVLVDRPRMNALVRRLLTGEITVEEQARFNEIAVRAMLEHGVREVRSALELARRGRA